MAFPLNNIRRTWADLCRTRADAIRPYAEGSFGNGRGGLHPPASKWRHRLKSHSQHGSIMPFIAMSVMLLMGTVGIASELTRIFEAVRELKFAAEAAALYACSLSTNSNGNYSIASAQSNIQNAVLTAGTAAWNMAECGPINGNIFASGTVTRGSLIWSEPVTFALSDIQFVNNPLDANEFFTQVTSRRQGSDALQQFFLPLLWLYTNPIGSKLPAGQYTASPHQTVEVLGQPASRLGAGAPLSTPAGTAASNFIGWAAFPLAISNQQFAVAADPSQTTTTYTIDLVSPSTSGPVQAGHIKGCLINVAAGSGSGSTYYGIGTGATAINQLISLLNYFAGVAVSPSATPAVIEQGSQLNAFNPTDPNFISQQKQITGALSQPQLLNKFYIVPVIANDPSFSSSNTVVGFARMNLDKITTTTSGAILSLTMDIGEAVPMYNVSCIAGFSAIPGNTGNTGNLLPAPVSPFLPRQFDPTSGGMTVRPRGVVLAPAISPRLIKFS